MALCGKLLSDRAEGGEDGLWAAGRTFPSWAELAEPLFPVSRSRFPLGSTIALMTGGGKGEGGLGLPRVLPCLPRPPRGLPETMGRRQVSHQGPSGLPSALWTGSTSEDPQVWAIPTFQLLLHTSQFFQDGTNFLEVGQER